MERAPKYPNMDWNGSLRSFVSRPPESSCGLLYNYSLDQFPVLEMKHPAVEAQQGVVGGMEKKKRLNNDQLESLERSFQEEVKLDPDRKMKLSKELGLQPRQIAVWFQNRRARWKAKQLEHLYDTLKQEFDAISREKHKLQQEVMRLRSMLREQAARNQGSAAYTDVSGEETVESTSGGVRSSNDYMYNVEDFNQMSGSAPPFWGGGDEGGQLPSYP